MLTRTDTGWKTLLSGRNGLMLGLISAGIGLHAFNQFAIVAAMPLAAAELGGRDWFSWVYSLYFIGSIAGGTSAAYLRDRLGVKSSLFWSMALFSLGGLMAVLAPSFFFIVAGRLLQGIADGLIVAICYSLIPANFSSAVTAKVFAVEATVWAVAALLGPLIGGLLAEAFSWHAAFLAVTPFLILLGLFTLLTTPETGSAAKAAFAPLAVALCVTASFIFALSSATGVIGWQVACLVLGSLALALTVTTDGKLGPRLFPAGAFRLGSVLGHGFWMLFLMSAGHASGATYLALIIRDVWGIGPAAVGYIVVAMALTWSAVAMASSRIKSLKGRHFAMRAGPLFQLAGFLMIAVSIDVREILLVVLSQMAIGTGFGLSWAAINQASMEAAGDEERDRASALLPTMSTAGYAVGSALAGMIAAATGLTRQLSQGDPGQVAYWLYGTSAAAALVTFLLGFGVRLKAGNKG